MTNKTRDIQPIIGMPIHYYIKGMPMFSLSSPEVAMNSWSGPLAGTICSINTNGTVNAQILNHHGGALYTPTILFLSGVDHQSAESRMTDRYCVPNKDCLSMYLDDYRNIRSNTND